MKNIIPPRLSTFFSENGKKTKRRFENIFNSKNKKRGAFIPAVFILCILSAEMLISCGSSAIGVIGGADGPTSIFVSGVGNVSDIPSDTRFFSAVTYADTCLYYDRNLSNKAHDVDKQRLIGILYDYGDICYVTAPVEYGGSEEGYIKKSELDFSFVSASHAFFTGGNIYSAPDSNSIAHVSDTQAYVRVLGTEGDYVNVSFSAADSEKWVERKSVAYAFIPSEQSSAYPLVYDYMEKTLAVQMENVVLTGLYDYTQQYSDGFFEVSFVYGYGSYGENGGYLHRYSEPQKFRFKTDGYLIDETTLEKN